MYREHKTSFRFREEGNDDSLVMTLIPIPRAEAGGLRIHALEVWNTRSKALRFRGNKYVSGR